MREVANELKLKKENAEKRDDGELKFLKKAESRKEVQKAWREILIHSKKVVPTATEEEEKETETFTVI
jgi:hypothetical protein